LSTEKRKHFGIFAGFCVVSLLVVLFGSVLSFGPFIFALWETKNKSRETAGKALLKSGNV